MPDAVAQPTFTRHEDGSVTMNWQGPDRCLITRSLVEQFVAEHNELVALRASRPVALYG
jgi:hypothetical protein